MQGNQTGAEGIGTEREVAEEGSGSVGSSGGSGSEEGACLLTDNQAIGSGAIGSGEACQGDEGISGQILREEGSLVAVSSGLGGAVQSGVGTVNRSVLGEAPSEPVKE